MLNYEKIDELNDEVFDILIQNDIYNYKDYKKYLNIKNKLIIENNILTILELDGRDVSKLTNLKDELKGCFDVLDEMRS